jgi:hypothetical protein
MRRIMADDKWANPQKMWDEREARASLLKLLLEIGELLAQGFKFSSKLRDFRFQLLDSLSIHR